MGTNFTWESENWQTSAPVPFPTVSHCCTPNIAFLTLSIFLFLDDIVCTYIVTYQSHIFTFISALLKIYWGGRTMITPHQNFRGVAAPLAPPPIPASMLGRLVCIIKTFHCTFLNVCMPYQSNCNKPLIYSGAIWRIEHHLIISVRSKRF